MLETLDGAQAGITALFDILQHSFKANNVDMLKWGAASSGVGQPNDVGWAHSIAHAAVAKLPTGALPPNYAHPAYSNRLTKILKDVGIEASSARTYFKFLCFVPEMLSEAFRIKLVKQGWEHAGYSNKGDVVRSLASWPGFDLLSCAELTEIRRKFEELVDIVRLTGRCSETSLERLTSDPVPKTRRSR